MKFVAVRTEKDFNYPGLVNYMEETTEFCTNIINELTEPIVQSNNCISVENTNAFEIFKIRDLTYVLESNKTIEIFETIQKDYKEDKEKVAILNNMPMSDMVYSLEVLLNSDNLFDFYTNILNFLQGKKLNYPETVHIINFLEDGPWGR